MIAMTSRPANVPANNVFADKVLVTDFDGTLTRRDFYELVRSELVPRGTPNYWDQYRTGQITHFQALAGYFASITADEATVLELVNRMEIDPRLKTAVAELQDAGWRIVIASAGCRWYIDRLLAQAGVQLELHANLGTFQPGRGLLMELPKDSAYFSPTHGIDKAAVVNQSLASTQTVAFAGDGYPDFDAAKLVPATLRFARGDLAETLTREGLPFHPFHEWSEVARYLLEHTEPDLQAGRDSKN
jgi:2-hydroxy-3-keto-5-methylthiopentenyl-1-phosphate phosphatase